ncbi:MAG: hypothetical protein G01um1014106_210 [Parcubacteria group bacterium Gr01-1014_106]|nr:MAG: hypothetical protein G01um1014106_210 [Parcubacteria group bacterium Gr01-1014_106]
MDFFSFSYPHRVLLVLLGTAVTIAVLILTSLVSVDIATRVAGGRFVVDVPNPVPSGGRVTVRWGVNDPAGKLQPPSPENRRRYPHEKIELEVLKGDGRKKYTLVGRTPNDGEETVTLPAIAPGATVRFVLTAANVKTLFGSIFTRSAAVTTVGSPDSSSRDSGGGGSSGGSSNSAGQINNSPPLADEFESDGRKITIRSDHSELIAGQTERITVTYALNHWPGTYKGNMEVLVTSPDTSNISPSDGQHSRAGGSSIVWSYSIPNGQSASFSFNVKAPPRGYQGRDHLEVTAQIHDTYGPIYLNQDGTAPEGPINVNRANVATWPIR